MTHVPFKGTSELVLVLLGGHVDVAFARLSQSERCGRHRQRQDALPPTSLQRWPFAPDVPTAGRFHSGLRFRAPRRPLCPHWHAAVSCWRRSIRAWWIEIAKDPGSWAKQSPRPASRRTAPAGLSSRQRSSARASMSLRDKGRRHETTVSTMTTRHLRYCHHRRAACLRSARARAGPERPHAEDRRAARGRRRRRHRRPHPGRTDRPGAERQPSWRTAPAPAP